MLAQAGVSWAPAASGDLEVGPGEVFPGAQKGLSGQLRGGVGQAVAEIQPGWVAAFSETPVSIDGRLPVSVPERHHRDLAVEEKGGQEAPGVRADTEREDDTGLGQSGRTDANRRGFGHAVEETLPSGLPDQNCDQG